MGVYEVMKHERWSSLGVESAAYCSLVVSCCIIGRARLGEKSSPHILLYADPRFCSKELLIMKKYSDIIVILGCNLIYDERLTTSYTQAHLVDLMKFWIFSQTSQPNKSPHIALNYSGGSLRMA